MLGFRTDPVSLLSFLAYSLVTTLIANLLAGGRRNLKFPRRLNPALVVSLLTSLPWVLLLTAAAMVAARYIERIGNLVWVYVLAALVGFCLSWVRARLYLKMMQHWRGGENGSRSRVIAGLAPLVHQAVYLLLALVLYLLLARVAGRAVAPSELVWLALGALLPDLDSRQTVVGRVLPFVSRFFESRVGQLQAWHSLGANVLVATAALPLIWVQSLPAWYALALGFLSHLIRDLLAPEGVMLFWPFTRRRYTLGRGYILQPGDRTERRLAAGLLVVAALLVFTADYGLPPVQPVASLSYEQTLDRYRSVRGRNLAFARVEGSWQATGRRISGRFEILNTSGESFVLLDRYSGKVFTAGRAADDNLYVNRIELQMGSSATIKPAEIHLEGQVLAEGMEILYQMQREPGIQHIFVSGDLIVEPMEEGSSVERLPVDYSQTELRHIVARGDGHYTLHYVPASEFVALADVAVQRADLVFIATIASPAAGPTVTPLPSPPAAPASQP